MPRKMPNKKTYPEKCPAEKCPTKKQKNAQQKNIDRQEGIYYNVSCVVKDKEHFAKPENHMPGCGSAWLERLVWDQEAAGSNPVTPILICLSGIV